MLNVRIDNVTYDVDRQKWVAYYKVMDSTIEACTGVCQFTTVIANFEHNITESCRIKVLRYIQKRDRTSAAILAMTTFDIEAAVSQTT